MDSTELLKQLQNQLQQQLQQYQNENKRDHDRLFQKIDQMSDKISQLSSDQRVNERRFDSLEAGQKEINTTVNAIDKRVKDLEERDLKRSHNWSLFLKALTVIAALGGIVTVTLKIIGFF